MGKLRDEAEALGIEVDGRWSNGTLTRKIAERKAVAAEETARTTEPEAKVKVRLLKHHKPSGWYRIVGHYDDKEKLVEGMAPAPVPGAGMAHKVWAGSVIELAASEAKRLVENITVDMVTDRDPDTKQVIGRREVRTRKPLAEPQVDWSHIEFQA